MSQKIAAIDQLSAPDLGDNLPSGLKDWERMQYKSFRKWVQLQLAQRNINIADLQEELKDGTKLYNLLELLTEAKIGKSMARPKTRIQSVNNLSICFDYMHKEGLRLENVGVEDIADGNLKLIMGLVWGLVLKYEIGKLGKIGQDKGPSTTKKGASADSQMNAARKFLMDWLKCIEHYKGVDIKNLTTSFSDGKAFTALCHLFNNNLVDYDKVANLPDTVDNKVKTLDDAFDMLEEEYGVPRMLDPKDMINNPDEKSVMTYLAACINALEKYGNKKAQSGAQGLVDPSKCVAYGPGTELASTAEPATFTIQSKDKSGNKVAVGGQRFQVKVKGPDGLIDAKVVDNDDGTYSVAYNPRAAGAHNVEITLDGKHIQNSPLIVEAEYQPAFLNEASHRWSETTGAGTKIASDAEPSACTIQAKNKYGNNVTKGGDPFKVAMKGPKAVEPKVVDNSDGTYSVSYQATAPGEYLLDSSLGGKSIYNSPHNVTVEHNDGPLTQTDPTWSDVSGPGAKAANTVEPARLTITSRNKYGNKVPKGGDKYKIDIQGYRGRSTPANIKDNNDGTYSVDYQPTAAGDHRVNISVLGSSIRNCPFEVPVSQVTDPSKCVAHGAGTQVASTAEPAVFTVQAKDAKGNSCVQGGDKVKLRVTGPQGAQGPELDSSVEDNGDGTYTLSYQPTSPGPHSIEVLVNGKPISNGLIKVNADYQQDRDSTADPRWSTATGAGVEVASTAEPSEFVVQARNKYGNPLSKGGSPFTTDVTVPTGAAVVPKVRDVGNGTYVFTYQATNPGNHKVDVKLGGKSIVDAPFTVPVDKRDAPSDEVDTKWSTATGPGVVAADTAAPAQFTYQLKNKYGNNINKGGHPIAARVAGSNGKPVQAVVTDNGNGSYGVKYQPTASGKHKVVPSVAGSVSRPINVPVTQETDASKTTLSGPGTKVASTAEPATFTINAHDRVGNPLNRGGDPFKVKISSPDGKLVEAVVEDNHDGTYKVTYQPSSPGQHTVEVSLEGKQVSGSPLKVAVDQNTSPNEETDPTWSTVSGAGTEIASTAETAEFAVQARNKYGNPIKKGGDQFKVELVGPKGAVPEGLNIADNKDGTYTVTYKATTPGQYVGDVTLKDVSLHKCPFKVDVEQNSAPRTEADPNWSTLKGPGVEAASTDDPANFTIEARNRYGNRVPTGGDDFKVRVRGWRARLLPTAQPKDNKDGTYSVSYQPVASGRHMVSVTLDGTPLKNTPVAVPVTQVTEPSQSVAKGAGTVLGSTAEPARFLIQAKDKKGNKCNRGGDPFKVSVKGPAGSSPVEATVRDNNDGTYLVEYQPLVAGAHQVDCSLNGKPISNASFKVQVDANAAPSTELSPKWSTAEGPGTELASTAEVSEFAVQAKNKYGNDLPFSAGPVQVAIKPPQGSPAVVPNVVDKGNGTYAVAYNPRVPGNHVVEVSLKGQPLFETPHTAEVEHNTAFLNEADARWSQGSGPATESANTTEPAVFTVQAKNKYGNKVTRGGDPFRPSVKAPVGTGAVESDVVDNKDGTYTVSYNPTASGLHKVDVALDGFSIRRAPYDVQVTQGTDPSKCFVEGPGTLHASTAEPANFTIIAKDKAGNKVTRGGDRFKATLTSPSGKVVPVRIRDNLDGTYSASYQPEQGGPHTLEVKLAGKPVSNSPLKVAVEQRPDPLVTADAAASEVSGAGTRVCSTAEPAVFTIQAKNKFGNNLSKGGDPYQVSIKAPAGSPPIPATVKDNGDGTYTVTYQPKVPGLHDIDATLGGKSLRNCPLKVTCDQNSAPSEEVSPQWSSASGKGLSSASTTAPAEFVVQAKNKYGNPVKKAGLPFKVDVKGGPNSKRVTPEVKDNGDGTYKVTYQPNVGGEHTVGVTLDNTPIYQAPFYVPVSQTTDASKCTAEGAGTTIGSTAEPATFTVVARDSVGNPRNAGGDPFVVKVTAPGGAPLDVKVRDNKDGTYAVTYLPKAAGPHTVDVTLNGKPISGVPTTANIEQRDSVDTITDPKWSTATGAGVELASTAEPAEFAIQARNKYGNPVKKGGDPFQVVLASSNGSNTNANVRDNGDGTYAVSYQASVPGAATVAATLKGTPIRNSPFSVIVDKNTDKNTESDPRWSTVSGDGASKATIVEPAELSVQARNKYGNPLNKGGDDFSVRVNDANGNPVDTTLTDNGDGTYSASYQPKAVGTHELGVALDGVALRGTPLDVDVKQGADPSKTVPFGPGLDSAYVGEPATFIVQAKDKLWNNVKGGGDNVQAKLTGPDGKEVPIRVTDNNNGTYTCEYTPQTSGPHKLDVTLDDTSISDCPRTIPVKQSTDPSKTTLDGPGISKATTTEPASFTIHSKDKSGAPLSVGGDDFYVKITPPKGGRPVLATVRDNEDGTYTATYQPTMPGEHVVDVSLNGQPVGGGSKKVDVEQLADPSRSVAYGPGFDEASTGNPAVFIVQAKDKNSNNLSKGGDKVEASLKGPSGETPINVTDNGNGTYTVTATPKAQGLHTLDIKLNGQPISNSSTAVPVKQDVSAAQSSASGSGLEKAKTGEPAEFTIQARDSSGAPVARGGDKFSVKVSNPEGMPVETKVKDNKDGTYTVSYTPYAPGNHKVEVALADKPVGKSPYKVDVTAGEAGVMGNYEMEVWRELNKARMNPSLYAGYLKDLLPSYDQSTGAFSVPNSDYVRSTQEGRRGVLEAIRFLEDATPSTPLKISEPFSNSARDLVADVGPKGLIGNTMSDGTDPATRLNKYGRWKNKVGEVLSYGAYSPRDVVIGWIVDDGVVQRPNRRALFDNEFTVVGISSGPHAKHMTMCCASLAGNYVEGDEEQRAKREVKVNYEKVTESFDKYETPDKKGYLIPAGNLKAKSTQLKLFKEGRQLHVVKTIPNEDGDPLTSDYRWDIPYDFEPISVTAKIHPLTDELFLHLAKPVGTLDPNQEVQVTSFTIGPNPKRPNNKMDMKNAQTPDYVLFHCFSSTCREDITVFLKGKALIVSAKRYEVGQDEEGEFTNITTSKRTVNLPFPVTLAAFSLVKGEEEFTIKILKPTSSAPADAQIEIPIQVGQFDE